MNWYLPLRLSDSVRINGENKIVTQILTNINVVISIYWLNMVKKYSIQNIKRRCGIKNILGTHGDIIADSGSFTRFRKGLKLITIDEIVKIYREIKVNTGFHADIPVAFLSKVSSQKTQKLLKKNIENAIKMENLLDSDFNLIVVAQGISSEDYKKQVSEFNEIGFPKIALGGIAYKGKNKIKEILDAIEQLNLHNLKIHTLGSGRLELLKNYRFIDSFDCSTPLDDAHRDSSGKNTFYYDLDKNNLNKFRLSNLRKTDFHPSCKCIFCKLYGRNIIYSGNNNRNRARSYHNVMIFDKYTKIIK